jgi:hypothetical protein
MLVKRKIIKRIGTGKFILGHSRIYKPDITGSIIEINTILKKQFPYLDYCIWNTSVFNEFMIHQPGKFYNMVETERDAVESVFYFLKENNYSAYLEPDEEILNKYASGDNSPVIVKPLVTESPALLIDGIKTAGIEKMLVDIFFDDITFASQQGSEMINIFKTALEKYSVSENRMLRYADRRGVKPLFNNFLNSVSDYRHAYLNTLKVSE